MHRLIMTTNKYNVYKGKRMNTLKTLLITTLTVVTTGTFISCETSSQQKSTSSQYHTSTGFMNPQTMLGRWGTDSAAVKKALDEQAETLHTAKESDPENTGTLSKLGETLYQRCRLSEARDVFLEALKLDPDNSRNNYLLGCTYYFLKDYSNSRMYIKYARRSGLRIDAETAAFFRKTAPEEIDLYQAKLLCGIDAPYSVQGLNARSIDEMLSLPDNQIDIATAALLIAQSVSATVFHSSFDLEEYRNIIDEYAEATLKLIGSNADPKHIVSCISKQLFFEEKLKPVRDVFDPFMPISQEEIDPALREALKTSLIHFVIDDKTSTPVALTILYLAIAERLNQPIYCVVAPRNIFARYSSGEVSFNIDPNNFGYDRSDQFFMRQPDSGQPVNYDYMKNLTKREALYVYLTYLSTAYKHLHLTDEGMEILRPVEKGALRIATPYVNLADFSAMKSVPEKTKYYFQKAYEINPNDLEVMYSLARVYESEENIEQSQELCEQIIEIDPDYQPVLEMLGQFYMLNRQLDDAIKMLSKAYMKEPDNVTVNTLLLEAYYAKNKLSQARIHAKKLSEMGKELDPQYQELLKQTPADKQFNFDDL